ncbi:MAG: ATP-dependent DNA ligase [Rhodospirillales bacterium]|nr:MAG: ATP-dependent DNA ligase [Rhodospirillales bacterium]
MASKRITVGDHTVELSNLDKVLFPDSGLTKRDLVDYYRRIAEVALPHYRDRPLSMHRFPDGIDQEGFLQKDLPDYFPDWIDRVELKKEGGTVTFVVANDAATLVYLANQGCITPHLGLARQDKPDHPDRLIFDLDPSDDDFPKVQAAAAKLKDLLDELELSAFVQTSGSRGLHVVVPLDRSAEFGAVRDFARALAECLARRHPVTCPGLARASTPCLSRPLLVTCPGLARASTPCLSLRRGRGARVFRGWPEQVRPHQGKCRRKQYSDLPGRVPGIHALPVPETGARRQGFSWMAGTSPAKSGKVQRETLQRLARAWPGHPRLAFP